MLNLKQKTMKKLLFIAMMCLMSAVTFGGAKASSNFQCTAHLYRTVFSGGHEYLIYTEATASTCAEAMSAAKSIADEIVEEM